jgi:Sigma-70, region 4
LNAFWVVAVAVGRRQTGDESRSSITALHAGTQTADAVLAIWQELVDAVLSPASAERFKAHPYLEALRRYPESRLRAAGTELYLQSGKLLLAEWARECAWDGGGTAVLDWSRLTASEPDAATVAGDLLAAAVASVRYERDRTVLTHRLGLDGDAAMTLQEIGQGLNLSRERVRQLQNRAVGQMCRQHTPPRASNYVGEMITDVISQAEDDGAEPAVALLTLANTACPEVPAGLAVQILARLAGRNKAASGHLAAEAMTLVAVRRAELAREARRARSAQQAAADLDKMLPNVEWPGGRAPAPPRSAIRPQRETDADGAGTWPSEKLAREVSYDSVAELSLIRVLDRAPQVVWFCEQPAAIGYTFAGQHRTYYPDLLIATSDGHCVLVEVKTLREIPLAINQAKAAAARAFCARHGWGYLVTDSGGRTAQDLLRLRVPEDAAQGFTDALHQTGTMTWREVKAQRERQSLTALQVSALALQRGWIIELGPYRVREPVVPRSAIA